MLGEIAVFNELLSAEERDECLAGQMRMIDEYGFVMKIGEILIERGLCDKKRLRAMLLAQAESRKVAPDIEIDIVKFTPVEQDVVAKRVLERQMIDESQAAKARTIQSALVDLGVEKSLAEIYLKMGYIERESVQDILMRRRTMRTYFFRNFDRPPEEAVQEAARKVAEQAEAEELADIEADIEAEFEASRREADALAESSSETPVVVDPASKGAAPARAPDVPKIGEIAVHNDLLTWDEVAQCLSIQGEAQSHAMPMMFGQILVEMEFLDRRTIEAMLRTQMRQAGIAEAEIDAEVEVVKFTDAEHEEILGRIEEAGIVEQPQREECEEIADALEGLGMEKKLAEIYLAKGYLPREMIEDILERRDQRRGN